MPLILADGKPWYPPETVEKALPPALPGPNEQFILPLSVERDLYEVGETASGIVITLGLGVLPDQIVLIDDQGNPNVKLDPRSNKLKVPYSYRLTSIGSVVLTVSLAVGTTRGLGTIVLSWGKRFMWGYMPTGQTASSLAAGLQHLVLTSQRQMNLEVQAGAGNKLWFFYPTAFGAAAFQIDELVGGVYSPQTSAFTNPFGVTENFYAYESVSSNLGASSPSPVEVS
jgi:hypothetical protein